MDAKRGLVHNLAATLADRWWVLLLRGMVAVLFGVLTFVQPGISLATLVLLFGAFVFADGVLRTWTAIEHRHDRDNWGLLLIGGLLGIGIGVMTWFLPGVTALTLLVYIAVWAIASGVLELATAIRLRKEIEGEWMLALSGLVSVAFGVVLVARPAVGALAVLWLIATYAIVYGVALVALSFRLRGFAHRLEARFA